MGSLTRSIYFIIFILEFFTGKNLWINFGPFHYKNFIYEDLLQKWENCADCKNDNCKNKINP